MHRFWLAVGLLSLFLALGLLGAVPGGVFITFFPMFLSGGIPLTVVSAAQLVLLILGIIFFVAGLI